MAKYIVLGIILGMIFEMFITWRVTKHKHIGTLRIDRSDPDGPYMFLELSTDVESVSKFDTVFLTVNDSNYITRN